MPTQTIATTPIAGQKPGTSGLRKQTTTFMEPGFLENYVQAIFDGIGGVEGAELVIGGDGRFFNAEAIGTILRMAAGNEAAKAIVGQGGILSTPAASNLIRKRGASGGLILSASHNPGGPKGDFGLKYNTANGGPASEAITAAIHACTENISQYQIVSEDAPALDTIGTTAWAGMSVEIVDPVADYAELMQELFDFAAIRALIAGPFTLAFDAMHAVTGPYATEILERRLGAAPGTVRNGTPLPDFGGGHPAPVWAKPLHDMMIGEGAFDFAAASDGDGDRNMILGRHAYVTPSDSLALLAANAHHAPGYARGLSGVARSMPTSRAADRVAEAMGIEAFETPTGWKFFGALLDAGRATLCGEESAGTGSDHVREKDGLWAVLLWLNILAATGKSVGHLLAAHWAQFGRDYYSRHDYEGVDKTAAEGLMDDLRTRLDQLADTAAGPLNVEAADDFTYTDLVDGSIAKAQGIRLFFEGGARAVLRLSDTGTVGATLRVYLERFEPPNGNHALDPQEALAPVIAAVEALTGLKSALNREGPDVCT